ALRRVAVGSHVLVRVTSLKRGVNERGRHFSAFCVLAAAQCRPFFSPYPKDCDKCGCASRLSSWLPGIFLPVNARVLCANSFAAQTFARASAFAYRGL